MKKIALYFIIVVLFLSTISCEDFLTIRPVGVVDEDALLNRQGIEWLVRSMYSALYQSSTADNWVFKCSVTNFTYGDVMAGDANKGSTYNDQPDFNAFEQYFITVDNPYLDVKWESCYNGIYRCNTVYYMADKCKDELVAIPGEEHDFYAETVAQARFLRAYWHFELVKLFGAAVPFVDVADYQSATDPKVSNVDESGNYIYIWDKILEDLDYACQNLPEQYNSEYGYANKWAAEALKAKVMIFQSSPYNGTNGNAGVNKWEEIKGHLETIMTYGTDSKGQHYKLNDNYSDLFIASTSDWTGESVFDVQMAISGTQTNTNGIWGSSNLGLSGALGTSGWGFIQPSSDLTSSHIVDESGLPYLSHGYQSFGTLTVLPSGNIPITDLTVYVDPRLDISVGRFGVPYWDWFIPVMTDGMIRDVPNGGLFVTKKNIPLKADQGTLSVSNRTCSTAKNYHIIRYADILLWYAEALIETGHPEDAREYVNQVRGRASGNFVVAADPLTMEPTISTYIFDNKIDGVVVPNAAGNYRIGLWPESQFTTVEGAREALYFERRIEFALEGHRWYDLVRWGGDYAYDEITATLDFEKQYLTKFNGCFYNSKWVTMPIPNDQIITMEGKLKQNENWR